MVTIIILACIAFLLSIFSEDTLEGFFTKFLGMLFLGVVVAAAFTILV